LKEDIFERVQEDLEAIETALHDNLKPYLSLVSEVARHILFAGGKRIRPLLMVLAARLCRYRGTYDATLSTVFEYLHTATLLHDDIVDGSRTRRGKPAAHELWGSPTTVLVGDYLFARASSIAMETGRLPIIKTLADTIAIMSEGEIQQLLNRENLSMSRQEYMDVIRRKTAVLIQAACHVGAMLADAAPHEEKALGAFGHHLGMAFQIKDDLLDYTADPCVSGKPVGTDLREGKLTLPLIHTLERACARDRLKVQEVLATGQIGPDDFLCVLDIIDRYGGLGAARQAAQEHISLAKDRLVCFPDSRTKETLMCIADFVLAREA